MNGYGRPVAVAVTPDGRTVYFAEKFQIYRIQAARMEKLAGTSSRDGVAMDGALADARFDDISALAIDLDGSLLVGERNFLRRVTTNTVTTVAGAKPPSPGNQPTTTSALERHFAWVNDIVVQSNGTVLLVDSTKALFKLENDRVTRLSSENATQLTGQLAQVIVRASKLARGAGGYYVGPDPLRQIDETLTTVKPVDIAVEPTTCPPRDGALDGATLSSVVAFASRPNGELLVSELCGNTQAFLRSFHLEL